MPPRNLLYTEENLSTKFTFLIDIYWIVIDRKHMSVHHNRDVYIAITLPKKFILSMHSKISIDSDLFTPSESESESEFFPLISPDCSLIFFGFGFAFARREQAFKPCSHVRFASMLTSVLKAHSHLASMSTFAFSKIIEAMVTKHKTQRMGYVPFLCLNVNFTIDTMLKFDANAKDANVNIDVRCERTFKPCSHVTFVWTSTSNITLC